MNLLLASGYQHERYSNHYILRNVHFSNFFYDFMAWRLAKWEKQWNFRTNRKEETLTFISATFFMILWLGA